MSGLALYAVLRHRVCLASSCLVAEALVLLAGGSGCTGDGEQSEAAVSTARLPLPPEKEPGFVDVTRAAGLDFVHSFGDARFSNLMEAVGSGAAWLDYDADGAIDLYLTTGKRHEWVSTDETTTVRALNGLFRNRGDGTFERAPESAGVGCAGDYSMGVASADYDNDGFPDIYVCNYGRNVLLRNRGDGSFEDVTDGAGVGDRSCSAAAVWLDYDRDGHLDLYVGNYIQFDINYRYYYKPDGFPGPVAYPPAPDRLYRNRGDGTFEDVTEAAGIDRAGRAMSVGAADLDGDGDDDIYVSNDAMENHLYRNEGGGRFTEVALTAGVAFNSAGDSTAHMAVDFGDFNADGRLDIFVSDSSISSLFRNEGDGSFNDVTVAAGVARGSAQFVGWGSFFFDAENDGDLDILKVNADLSRPFGQEPQLFENDGAGGYRDSSSNWGAYFEKEWMARGAACADYDNDGDVDIVVVNLNSPATLLRNDGHRSSWIEILLRGGMRKGAPDGAQLSNRDGIGARVTITAGGRTQMAERRSSSGYLSQNDPRLHFGLGEAEIVERIEVVWPSGKTRVLADVPARSAIVVEEVP